MNILTIYTYLSYLIICSMNQENRFCSFLCKLIGLISIAVVPVSFIYSIYWLFGTSLILTVIAYSHLKYQIQQFIVKTVILFRCSCSSQGWVKLGSDLKQTKFDGKFAFPTQTDTVHILLLIGQINLAGQLAQHSKDDKIIWMAKRYIEYYKQKKSQNEYKNKQIQALLERLFRNYFHNSLQQKINHKKMLTKWIKDLISIALDYRNSKTLIVDKINKAQIVCQQKFGLNQSVSFIYQYNQQIQVPNHTYYQTESYLNSINKRKDNLKENVNGQSTKAINLKSTQFSTLSEQFYWKRGLNNLGNTCYMNSAIQCLHKSFELTRAIKEKGKLNSPFILEYLKLMDELSKNKNSSQSPHQIKQFISHYNSRFQGNQQQDSCQLLSTLLNCIHDQLNEVKSQNYYDIDKTKERTDQQLLQQYIKKDQSRSKSVIDDIFYGRFLTTYKCLECPGEQKLFQKFNVIYLPVLNKPQMDLEQCMRQFCRPDLLRGDEAWFCSNCQKDTPTDKTMSVYQANKILIICLKRFDQNSKINSLISFDHQITLSQITKNPGIENFKYDLYGVINHFGKSLNHGHYYSYCKVGKCWKKYNDEYVSEIKQNRVISSNAFVLLYRLRERYKL